MSTCLGSVRPLSFWRGLIFLCRRKARIWPMPSVISTWDLLRKLEGNLCFFFFFFKWPSNSPLLCMPRPHYDALQEWYTTTTASCRWNLDLPCSSCLLTILSPNWTWYHCAIPKTVLFIPVLPSSFHFLSNSNRPFAKQSRNVFLHSRAQIRNPVAGARFFSCQELTNTIINVGLFKTGQNVSLAYFFKKDQARIATYRTGPINSWWITKFTLANMKVCNIRPWIINN
jgi:hypothetical protein